LREGGDRPPICYHAGREGTPGTGKRHARYGETARPVRGNGTPGMGKRYARYGETARPKR